MGGVKKKSLASMEKSQDSEDTSPQASQETKGKKAKEQKSAPQQKKQLTFLAPKLTDQELMKSLSPLKAVTVHTASRALGVNASIASSILRGLEERKILRRAGGFSGHVVWAVAQVAPAQ
jgi:small subunit ribosomal protein S25e